MLPQAPTPAAQVPHAGIPRATIVMLQPRGATLGALLGRNTQGEAAAHRCCRRCDAALVAPPVWERSNSTMVAALARDLGVAVQCSVLHWNTDGAAMELRWRLPCSDASIADAPGAASQHSSAAG
ncbi:hypothetical protein VPH35_060470 [Triticum aestivum]